jgi:hypothetical protein
MMVVAELTRAPPPQVAELTRASLMWLASIRRRMQEID